MFLSQNELYIIKTNRVLSVYHYTFIYNKIWNVTKNDCIMILYISVNFMLLWLFIVASKKIESFNEKRFLKKINYERLSFCLENYKINNYFPYISKINF